jgi:ABC-type nitrate/sulfonate/bicarbonate transport system permease component
VFNPFAGGGKPPFPQLEALARAAESAHALGVHHGATWGFAAGVVVGVVLALWMVRTAQRQKQESP